MRDGRFSFALGDRRGGRGGAYRSRHAVQYAPPARHHAVQCAPPARPTLRSVRLPLTEAAAKLLAMLCWVRPDQIVMLKLLRESRNKNLDFFATFFAIRDCSELSNQGLRCKSAGKSVSWRPVFALWGRKRAPNRKKVAKMPQFLFSRWEDCPNG